MTANKTTMYTPEGYTTAIPYFMIDSIGEYLDYLATIFPVEIPEQFKNPTGALQHAEARIGNAVLWFGQASDQYPARQNTLYLFVENADHTFKKAIENGAKEIMPPTDTPYRHRECGFTDPFGNQWWVAHTL